MNGFYVTLCVSFLLVLAEFNNAHGLTTFGKTQNTTPPPFHAGSAKPCTNHTQCKPIPNTSCVQDIRDSSRKSCLCGDNTPPSNGLCKATRKGAGHLCSDDCVEDATCIEDNGDKVCKCNEGFVPTFHGYCSGAVPVQLTTVSLLVLVVMHLHTLTSNP